MDQAATSIDQRVATQIAIALVEYEDGFLIGRRPEGVALAGYWEFPGGKVKAGETAAHCAARECLEETGVEIEVLAPYMECIHEYEHGRLQLHFFKCRPRDAKKQPRSPFCWVPRCDLSRYEFPAANQVLLKMLAECST